MFNQTLQDIGELRAVQRICKSLPMRDDVLKGAGDDCAVVRSAGSDYDWLLTSDPLIQDVHFTKETPGRSVGHKALGRVLSDIAAMGGEPLWCLIDVVALPETPVAWLDELYQGISDLALRYDVAVVGGDMARGPVNEVHVFEVGRVPKGKAVLRSGAGPGHELFVTGSLGGALTGKHLCFEPRLAEGRWLSEQQWASAMIDLSDGLASDLRHLTDQSHTGAELVLGAIPLSKAALDTADKCSALDHALRDGEDYELLFVVPQQKAPDFLAAWRRTFELACTRIGVMTETRGMIECIDEKGKRTQLRESGYDHFA